MDNVIDQIKQKLDVVEVIGGYLRLTKAGRNYKARCPLHNERTPSFMVSPERQIWHCFGCGQGGDIFGFVMKIEGMEFGDALRLLARKAGVVLKKQDPQVQSQKKRLYELCELSTRFFETQLAKSSSGKKVQQYLKERGLEPETIKTWRLGWAPDEWRALSDFLRSRGYKKQEMLQAGLIVQKEENNPPTPLLKGGAGGLSDYYDRFRSRIIFPIFDIQGQVVAFGGRIFEIPTNYPINPAKAGHGAGESKRITNKEKIEPAKYVNSPQTPLYDKSRILYGLHKSKIEIRAKDQCIIVEGYMDLLMSWQGEVQNVVASSGTALTEMQLNIIGRYTKNLAMAFDTDMAGDAATRRSIDLALKQDFNIKVIALKDKDPAEAVKKNPQDWQKAIEQAQSVMEFYFASTSAKFNSQTLEGKREIKKILLPVIKAVASKTEQSEWLRELARRLRVDEKDLMFDMQNIKSAPAQYQPASESGAPLPGHNQSRPEALEERFLGLCLDHPQYFENFAAISEDDFQNQQLAQIFGQLKSLIEQKKETDLLSHLQKSLSPELKLQLDYLSLKIQSQPADELQVTSEIEGCLRELKIIKIRQQLVVLSYEIKEVQAGGAKLKLHELLEKFTKLSSELIELTKR
ncbi:MAG: DNA primase [Parcubacteria group bacterium LiPW_39]|nr:MAG: DNA primase [Parcubacteria group bacterium LiPW_39]